MHRSPPHDRNLHQLDDSPLTVLLIFSLLVPLHAIFARPLCGILPCYCVRTALPHPKPKTKTTGALVPSSPLFSTNAILKTKQMGDLQALHQFHRLLSVLAAAHGRIEVPKLHGRLSTMIFSSPQDALSKQTALHMLEDELLNTYETKYSPSLATSSSTTLPTTTTDDNATSCSTINPSTSGDVCGTYFFWIVTANYTGRDKGASELEQKYPNISAWMSRKRTELPIQKVCEQQSEMISLQERFRKTLKNKNATSTSTTTTTSLSKSLSNLNTKSPLTTAIAQLKLLSASLHLSSEHEATMHSVLQHLSRGEKVLDVNVFQGIQEGKILLDKDTESWMKAELRRSSTYALSTSDSSSTPRTMAAQGKHRRKLSDDSVPLLEMLPETESLVLNRLIPRIGTWELDILGEYESLQQRPLFYVCMAAVHRDGVLDLFVNIRTKAKEEARLNSASASASASAAAAASSFSSSSFPVKEKFMAFITALESKYDARNAYHNNCHAADVVNSMVCLLNDGKSEKEMTVYQRMSSIVAAAAHDVAHTGQNNGFHAKYQTEYAIQYSNRSVMEMHHLATTFQLLNEDRYNMFGAMSRDDYSSCRKLIIEMIMATDLSKHFDLLNNYSIELDKDGIVGTDKLLEIVLKAADIGHAVKEIPIHQKWSRAVSLCCCWGGCFVFWGG